MYCNNVKVILYFKDDSSLVIDGMVAFPKEYNKDDVIKYKVYINDAPNTTTSIDAGTFIYMHRITGTLTDNIPPNRHLRIGYTKNNTEFIEEILVYNE